MKTEKQIRDDLKKVAEIVEKYNHCKAGTDGWRIWLDAFHTQQALQWVLSA